MSLAKQSPGIPRRRWKIRSKLNLREVDIKVGSGKTFFRILTQNT